MFLKHCEREHFGQNVRRMFQPKRSHSQCFKNIDKMFAKQQTYSEPKSNVRKMFFVCWEVR